MTLSANKTKIGCTIGPASDSPEILESMIPAGDHFALTSEDIMGIAERVSMSFAPLPQVVKPGDNLFINDGIIHLEVIRIVGKRYPQELQV